MHCFIIIRQATAPSCVLYGKVSCIRQSAAPLKLDTIMRCVPSFSIHDRHKQRSLLLLLLLLLFLKTFYSQFAGCLSLDISLLPVIRAGHMQFSGTHWKCIEYLTKQVPLIFQTRPFTHCLFSSIKGTYYVKYSMHFQ